MEHDRQPSASRNGGNRGTGATRRRVLGAGAAGAALLPAGGCGAPGDQSTAPRVAPATVRYLHVDTGQQVWQDNWGQIFSSFEARYPGVKLQVEGLPGGLTNLAQKAVATFSAGDYYDMLYGHFSVLPTFLDGGILQPLDGFLSKDREVRAADFHAAATESKAGKMYGIAWFTQADGFWYNADLVAQAGGPMPKQLEKEGRWTWDTMLDLARKLTKVEGNETKIYGFTNYFFTNLLWAFGGDWFDRGFTRPTIDTPQFLAAAQFEVDLVTKHRVGGGGNFNAGTLAMRAGGCSLCRGFTEQVVAEKRFEIGLTLLPKGPAGRPVAMINNCNYVAKTAKAPEATWLFYKHLIGAEVQPQIARLGGGRFSANKRFKPTTLGAYEDADVWTATAANVRPLPLITKQADLDKEWADALKGMTKGPLGVRDGLLQVQARAGQLLKEGGCLC